MPNAKLRVSQVMTTGANEPATFVVPNGCTRNKRTKIAQEMPTIVAGEMSGFAMLSPAN